MSKRPWGFVVGGLLVALLLAGVVSNYASSHPDGLDSSLLRGCTVDAEGEITGGSCPAQQERDHELADSPLADYGVRGLDNDFLSTGLSGVLGVLLTFAVGGGVFWLLRRRGPQPPAADRSSGEPAADRTTRQRTAAESPADSASRAARSR
ncbi:cobalamin biosynthesis protein CbiM [Micromonospora sp. KC207]|uniref:PDGLE domain-containing protein n=1 Tax=Micromonospora sp. KC207 TaxID=2530377 RepID=UPI00104A1EB0|nr:PDGLE domain-containing protein [Micromonospora sp. KC207]TDC58053.1 cobalamin biosynthesis protein CbiM [Micromonospora sp. KC207]